MKASARLQAAVLLFGIITGFVGAVLDGHRATSYSKPSNFHRFHAQLSPQGAFYPPFSMLENLALARWRPGKTVVIVGGTPSSMASIRQRRNYGPTGSRKTSANVTPL